MVSSSATEINRKGKEKKNGTEYPRGCYVSWIVTPEAVGGAWDRQVKVEHHVNGAPVSRWQTLAASAHSVAVARDSILFSWFRCGFHQLNLCRFRHVVRLLSVWHVGAGQIGQDERCRPLLVVDCLFGRWVQLLWLFVTFKISVR